LLGGGVAVELVERGRRVRVVVEVAVRGLVPRAVLAVLRRAGAAPSAGVVTVGWSASTTGCRDAAWPGTGSAWSGTGSA
jgi:hypothetical protein